MPLPPPNSEWPPRHYQPMYSKMAEWAAWYSSEPSRIMNNYAASPHGTGGVPWWRFWTRHKTGADAQRAMLHVPLAADLAATSGALLFGESPSVRIRAARAVPVAAKTSPDVTGELPVEPPEEPEELPETPEQKAEARLLEMMEGGAFFSRLVEAAETAAAVGGVYIYPAWDKDLLPYPILNIVQADQAVPEFRLGVLTAVTFFRKIYESGNDVRWHLERHEVEGEGDARKAVVINGVYDGRPDYLGSLLDPRDVNDFAQPMSARVELPFPELDVEYIPNKRPNPLFRSSALGVADIQGSESLLDALDETYASWMRDVRLAKARILVPREYLRPDAENANEPTFDVDQEIYVGLDMEPGLSQDARAMLAHQFAIRFEEHRATADNLIARIVSKAGYAVSTMGAGEAGENASAMRRSQHKTLLTLRQKSGWWRPAVANILYRMQLIDRDVFGSTAPAIRPVVALSDSIIDQPLELAQTALALKTAESASVETRVRLVHPDWSETEIDAEVKRIEGEKPKAPPAVTPAGSFGDPAADKTSTTNLPTRDPNGGPAPKNDPPASPPFARNE